MSADYVFGYVPCKLKMRITKITTIGLILLITGFGVMGLGFFFPGDKGTFILGFLILMIAMFVDNRIRRRKVNKSNKE